MGKLVLHLVEQQELFAVSGILAGSGVAGHTRQRREAGHRSACEMDAAFEVCVWVDLDVGAVADAVGVQAGVAAGTFCRIHGPADLFGVGADRERETVREGCCE